MIRPFLQSKCILTFPLHRQKSPSPIPDRSYDRCRNSGSSEYRQHQHMPIPKACLRLRHKLLCFWHSALRCLFLRYDSHGRAFWHFFQFHRLHSHVGHLHSLDLWGILHSKADVRRFFIPFWRFYLPKNIGCARRQYSIQFYCCILLSDKGGNLVALRIQNHNLCSRQISGPVSRQLTKFHMGLFIYHNDPIF